MDIKGKIVLYWLSGIPGFGASSVKKICDRLSSPAELLKMREEQIRSICAFTEKKTALLLEYRKNFKKAEEEYEKLNEKGILFLTPYDLEYPKRLKKIENYPMGLYLRGKLPPEDQPAVAIIGARACSAYGEKMAEYIGENLGRAGVSIISGLAVGIDAAGHKGALKAGAATYGILGCGVDICYPAENYNLYEKMILTGGVLSEYPLKEAPKAWNFPVRNRIISGLADAVIVVEAREKSGSLITVETALEQGKEVFALPGRITDSMSRGCNRLIQQGANMCTGVEDILDYFDIKEKKQLKPREEKIMGLAKNQKMVYACLDLTAKHIDQICTECGLPVQTCMGTLLELELESLAVCTSGQYYAKNISFFE